MLEDLGLSSYESSAYIVLLEKGGLTARQLSNESAVPYGRVYDVLKGLEDKGLVVKTGGRPVQFHPTEPDLAIERLKKAKVAELDNILERADSFVDKLQGIYRGKTDDQLLWKVGVGEESTVTYLSSIEECKKSYWGYAEITEKAVGSLLPIMQDFIKTLHEHHKRGVEIRLLIGVESPEDADRFLEAFPNAYSLFSIAEVRVTPVVAYPFSIIDDEKVLIKVKNPAALHEDIAVMYVWQKGIAKTLMAKFQEIWSGANEISVSFSNTGHSFS